MIDGTICNVVVLLTAASALTVTIAMIILGQIGMVAVIGASPGKLTVGLRIRDSDGRTATTKQAAVRALTFGWTLAIWPVATALGIDVYDNTDPVVIACDVVQAVWGVVVIGPTFVREDRRCLHDVAAGTFIGRRKTRPNRPSFFYRATASFVPR